MRLILVYAFLSFSVAADGDIPGAGANARKAAVQNAGPTLLALYAYGINPADMTTDAAGNIYLTGFTISNVFPATAGSVQPFYSGGVCPSFGPPITGGSHPCADAFVIKLNSAGGIVYATYLGGNGDDYAAGIATDAEGNAYVTGSTVPNGTNPNNFPVTPHALFQQPSANGGDGFLAKLSPNGDALVYSTYLPGADQQAVAADQAGNAYLALGVAPNSPIPTTPGAFQTKPNGGQICKLSPDGTTLLYSTFLGGTAPGGNSDLPDHIAVDADGGAYITGTAASPDFPITIGAYQTTGGLYLTKLNPTGSALVYSTFPRTIVQLGGALELKLDGGGHVFLLSQADNATLPLPPGAFQSNPSAVWSTSGQPPLLLKMAPDGGSLVYTTYFSGAAGIDVDQAGDAFVVAQGGAGFPVTAGASQRCMNGGGNDVIAAELDPDGHLTAASYLGGSGDESPLAIANLGGQVAVAGTTNSTDFPGIAMSGPAESLLFVSAITINDPQITDGPCMSLALENGASFVEGAVAPGEIVTLRGEEIGPESPAYGEIGPKGALPTVLGGTQVFFDGVAAPLLYAQSKQVNAIVPFETSVALLLQGHPPPRLHVEYNGAATNIATLALTNAAPGIFLENFATGQAAILNQDGTLNSPAHTAKVGSVISIFGTGGDFVIGGVPDGELWPSMPLTFFSSPVVVTFDGVAGEVLYGGSAPDLVNGVFQINARVPAVASNVTIQFSSGQTSVPVPIFVE